jgi:hypothetical protein
VGRNALDKEVGDDWGGVVLVGPKEDVKELRPELGIEMGEVLVGLVLVGVVGAGLAIGLVALGILTFNASVDLRSALSRGLLWGCGWT